MLPRAERLTTAEFDRAFRHPRVQILRHPLVHLKFAPSGEPGLVRAAFVVPKKQGKANVRNSIRRRLRECYRLHSLRQTEALRGWDLIFLATAATAGASGRELDEALSNVVSRAAKRLSNLPPESPEEGETPPEIPRLEHELSETTEPRSAVSAPLTLLALTLIRFYQKAISPSLPPSCRFYPTCSRYTYEAIERYGALRGGALGLRRVCRCHPWHPGGFDPVPESLNSGAILGTVWRRLFVWKRRPRLSEEKFG